MNDSGIALAIIIKCNVNVGNFCNWYCSHLTPTYENYLLDFKEFNMGLVALDDFQYKFIRNYLTLVGAVQ